MKPKIWLVFGLSGAGKTYFSDYVAKKHQWIHCNIDQRDGLDIYSIKDEWIKFWDHKEILPLWRAMKKRYQADQKFGAILSFPSNYILDEEHIKAAEEYMKTFYLVSTKENCLNSFLERERRTPRKFFEGKSKQDKIAHWDTYNTALLKVLPELCIKPYTFDTFNEKGVRKSAEELYEEVTSLQPIALSHQS